MMNVFILFLLLSSSSSALAHESHDPQIPEARLYDVASEKNIVKITQDENFIYIKSNGIPDHKTGQFPNRGNPNAISAQNHNYRVSLNPSKTGRIAKKDGVVGVALNGIPFEPGTAECYGRARGQRGPMQSCEWREEAIINGKAQLGLDQNNAHVQPTGTYHYHGIPLQLVQKLQANRRLAGPDFKLLIGYAADGFPMFVSTNNYYKSSYALKSGTRPSGPGGKYTGNYTADFEYKADIGHLDECNGVEINGTYMYLITQSFPFVPRCLKGQPDQSFERKGHGGNGNAGSSSNRRPHRRPPPHHRF